jgi:hypothetical protein
VCAVIFYLVIYLVGHTSIQAYEVSKLIGLGWLMV